MLIIIILSDWFYCFPFDFLLYNFSWSQDWLCTYFSKRRPQKGKDELNQLIQHK